MKVRMKVAISGTRNGQRWPAVGGTVELTDPEAVKLVDSGMAVPVVEDDVETAVPEPVDAEERKAPRKKAARRGDAEPS